MAVPLRTAPIRFDFTRNAWFHVVAGTGKITVVDRNPMRLESPATTTEMIAASAPFRMRPIRVYEVPRETRLDRGTELGVRLRPGLPLYCGRKMRRMCGAVLAPLRWKL